MRVLFVAYGAQVLVIFLNMLHELLLSISMQVFDMSLKNILAFEDLLAYVTW